MHKHLPRNIHNTQAHYLVRHTPPEKAHTNCYRQHTHTHVKLTHLHLYTPFSHTHICLHTLVYWRSPLPLLLPNPFHSVFFSQSSHHVGPLNSAQFFLSLFISFPLHFLHSFCNFFLLILSTKEGRFKIQKTFHFSSVLNIPAS